MHTLRLAGTPHCVGPDGRVYELGAPDALLLAWLAVEGATSRERLAALLWPDSGTEAARNALRQRLFRLRKLCGVDLVDGSQQLALAEGVTHDLHRSAELLAALDFGGETALSAWLRAERARRRESERARLAAGIEADEHAGDPAAALPAAQRLLELDPLSEDAHRRLMRLHYLAGDRAAALRAFDRCEQVLKDEVGARPSPETLALLATIERAEPGAASAAAARRTLPAALMRPPRLVGRDDELAQLKRSFAAGERVLVTGEAGLGKSRLLQAFAADTVQPLYAAGRPGDALAPYATLARALRELERRLPRALDAADPGALAPLLPERALGAERAAVTREAMVAALLAVLRMAMRAQHGIVLDDLHFADTATLQLLPELLAGSGGADGQGAWVLSLRPPDPLTPQAALVDALSAAGTLQRLSLRPLDLPALAELVDSLALPGARGAELAPMLAARSGGNPLYALETLKLAWSEGHLQPGDALPRPATVGQLIETSLAALTPQALLLARVAAIASVDFSIELAEHVLKQGALQLADAWSELEARHVLRGTAFAHDLVHEQVLAGIPEVLARHTHATVAQWLEAAGGEPARVAAHWEAAGQHERALPGLRAAAERAHAALREEERIGFLVHAADIAQSNGRPDEAFELLGHAVQAHMNAIREVAGFELLDRMDTLARTPLQRARAASERAWYCTNLADLDGAIEAGKRALEMSAALSDAGQLRAMVSQRLGTALSLAGRFDEALAFLRAAEAWFDDQRGTDAAAEFHGNLAVVLDNLGQSEAAREHHLRAIDITRALGSHSFHVTTLANFARSRLDVGDVAGAAQPLEGARQMVTAIDRKGASAAFVASLQAQVATALGDYAQALQYCDVAEALLANANPAWLPVVLMHRARIWLDLGQLARAQQALAQADTAHAPPRVAARRLMLLARLQRALGHDAHALLERALDRAPVVGWPELRLSVRIDRASADLDASAARRELADVAAQAAALGLFGVQLAAHLRGAQIDGDDAFALRSAEAALALADRAEPNALYRGERWLAPALALARAGQLERARSIATEGKCWVEQTASERVPEPHRDSYLNRQPINLALLRLAALA